MYVYVPDQYPGRCLNHRWIDGQLERCLDYEKTAHVCSFPEPPAKTWEDMGVKVSSVSTTWKHKTPTPWVKPGDEKTNERREDPS